MKSSLDVEFVSMPRTDNVRFGFVVFLRANGAVLCDRFKHALHDAALTDRSGALGASVVPCVEVAIHLEDADLTLSAHDDFSVAVRIVGHFLGALFIH